MNIHGIDDFISAAARRRIVLLGECSYDLAEFYSVKTEIVRRLVDEAGFSVLAVESGVAAVAQSMSADCPKPVDQLNGLRSFARTPQMYSLLQWRQRSGDRARFELVGIDPHASPFGADWVVTTLRAVGFQEADSIGEIERSFDTMFRRLHFFGAGSDDGDLVSVRRQLADCLHWFRSLDSDDVSAMTLERVLGDRLSLLDVIGNETAYEEWRERRMAATVEWWCKEMFAAARIIVWAHNHHVMRQHSSIDGVKSMAEFLPGEFWSDAMSLGIYAGSGVGVYPDRSTFAIPDPPADSVEHYGINEDRRARITLLDAGVTWANELCIARQWGIEEELLVPAEQFDAVCVVANVTPREEFDSELMRRIAP